MDTAGRPPETTVVGGHVVAAPIDARHVLAAGVGTQTHWRADDADQASRTHDGDDGAH